MTNVKNVSEVNIPSLLKIIQLSQKNIQKGKSKPAKEVFSSLRKKYGL